MMLRPVLLLLLLAAALPTTAVSRSLAAEPDKTLVYRPEARLALDIYYPERRVAGEKRPALVFFHGGGWNSGHRGQFAQQAEVLTNKSRLIVISVDYPLNRNPVDAADAGQGAVCWLRRQAADLGIDETRIALAGASAGAQVAAAAALLQTSSPSECTGMPAATPAALVLFSPVLDLKGRFRGSAVDVSRVSPMDIVGRHLPPTLILHGTDDRVVPARSSRRFAEAARQAGAPPVTVVEYPGRSHGFFNNAQGGDMGLTLNETTTFLKKLGWPL